MKKVLAFVSIPVIFVFAAAVSFFECDCSGSLTPSQVNTLVTAGDAAACVLGHISAPSATIAVDCFGNATFVTQVEQILTAHLAAEAREQATVKDDAGQE